MEQAKVAFNLSIANIFVFLLGVITGIPMVLVLSLVLSSLALTKISKIKKQGLVLDSKARTARTISYILLGLTLLFAIFIFIIPNIAAITQ